MPSHENDLYESKTILNQLLSVITNKYFILVWVFIIGVFVGYYLKYSQIPSHDLPPWAIIEGLEIKEDAEEASKIFDTRVQAEFPSGLDEQILIRELSKAGFRLDWFTDNGLKMAYHDFWTWDRRCKEVRSIVWQINNKHIIKASSGSIAYKCKRD